MKLNYWKWESKMANGINKVILVGNLGEAPEIRYMPSGAAACNFSLATSESWKDANGQKQERTEWHRCSAFDRGNYKMAEYIAESCQKGTKLYVEGSLQTREWEKDGIKRYTTEIKVNEFQILAGSVPRDGQQPQQSGNSGQLPPAQPAAQPQSFGSFDTDWSGYKPSATTNGATIEQVKKKYSGDLQAAIKNGHVEVDGNSIDDLIPF